jgi:hypothetical protein
VSVLIATALGALAIGFACGLIVKINYPDGTSAEIHVPDGGRVTVVPAEKGEIAENNSQTTASSTGETQQTTTLEFAPIFFAILKDQDTDLIPPVFPGDDPMAADTGAWYPLADNVNVPNAKSKDQVRLALIEDGAEARIPWKEIQGHLSAQARFAGGAFDPGYEVELLFDKELAAKMKRLSEDNLNRQLAIIFNNRIVSAPYIRGPFGERAHISGRFKQEEVRFLMQALSGGLVDPLPTDSLLTVPNATEEPSTKSENLRQ